MPINPREDLLRLFKAVKIVRGLRKALTITEREAFADDAVRRIEAQRGDPWQLNEELPLPGRPSATLAGELAQAARIALYSRCA